MKPHTQKSQNKQKALSKQNFKTNKQNQNKQKNHQKNWKRNDEMWAYLNNGQVT